MGRKAVGTTRDINAFGLGATNEGTVQCWFKFCKEDESLEGEERSGRPMGRWHWPVESSRPS